MRKGPLGAWSLVLMTSGWQNSLRDTALLRPLCKDLCPSLPIPGLSNSQVVRPRQGLLLMAVGNEPSLPVGICALGRGRGQASEALAIGM